MSRNVYTATKYMREILRNSSGEKVLVDKEKLRTIVGAVELSNRYVRDKALAKQVRNEQETQS